jgi:hypothetical protein
VHREVAVNAELEHTNQPAAAQKTPPLLAAPLAAVRPLQPGTDFAPGSTQAQSSTPERPDKDRAMSLLFLFLGALAVMVGDGVLVSAVERWWILILAAGVLLLITFVVLVGIIRLLADG